MNAHSKTITIFWYSQTGHSYTCARAAESLLRKNCYDVRFRSIFNPAAESFETELFLFVFPVFNFSVPLAVKRFLEDVPEKDNRAAALLILTCAGMAANTAKITQRLLHPKNIDLSRSLVIRCRDSYIPFAKWFGFLSPKNKPDAASYRRVEHFLESNLIAALKPGRIGFNPFNLFHWFGAAAPEKAAKLLLGKRIFKQERCAKCGFCAALCPTGAITMVDDTISYSDSDCIGCCGCMNICPENAWQSSLFGPSSYNKGLQVKEMAQASGKWRQPG